MLYISTPSSLFPRPPVNLFFISVSFFLFIHVGCPCAWDQTSKQTNKQNNRKTHHPDKVGLSLRERWGKRSCLLTGPVPFHCDGRGGLPGHDYTHTSVWLLGWRGSSQSSVHTDTSSDPICCWLKPRACSLYLSCSFSSLACSIFERLLVQHLTTDLLPSHQCEGNDQSVEI